MQKNALINQECVNCCLIIKAIIVDSLKDGASITGVTLLAFYTLKAMKVKPPTASLDPTDADKLGGGICLGTLFKDYMVYKKWIDG